MTGDLSMEAEVGGFLVPSSDGGGDVIHCLDMLHESDGYYCGKVGDKSGGVFDFIVLGVDNVQFEMIDILLELFSRSDASGGEPIHGFLLDIGIPEGFFKVGFESGESPKGLTGKSLLVVNFGPRGSGAFLHVRQGVCNFPVVIIVEGGIDQKIEAD